MRLSEGSLVPPGYDQFLTELKERIGTAQIRAAVSVNRELVLLYWQIGRSILARQTEQGWGAGVIDRLSADLRREFPEMKGFSPRNLRYMRTFAESWPDEPILQEALAELPWYHHVVLLTKLATPEERLWYARQTTANGWSGNVLALQIQSGLIRRAGAAQTNFERTLPAPQSDLAQAVLKDPYNFDFLTLGSAKRERDLHRGLLAHVREFLLELGMGFAFVGSEYPLTVGESDFYLDMLFYHLRLRCFVVVELKVGDFEPEYAGKLNFYLSAVDGLVRHADDQPSIGILLCKTPDRLVVEYALRDVSKPIGVATYQIVEALPEELAGRLPTIEELETELGEAE